MNYLDLILQQQQDKIAIITDDNQYTYGELAQKAKNIRQTIDLTAKRRPIFIHEDKIIDQLISFLAYSGTNHIPIIATDASKNQEFIIKDIPENACMGVMTSGSTGKSKLFWRNYNSWADFFPIQNKIFNINKDTVIFCQGSLAFTGNLNIYLGVFACGGTVIATEKFRPKNWLDLMTKYKVNAIYLIPTKLLLLPKFATLPNTQIKQIISGSQSMNKQDAIKLKQIYPKTTITLYYGASELNYITYINDIDMTEDRTSVGKPFTDVKITIKNEEIFVNTPYHVEGISLPFSLKDKGYIDTNGSLHFLGRKDDICNINGLKISTSKIENALIKVFQTNELIVIPSHKNDSDTLKAFIAGEKQFTKQEILKSLKPYLTDFEMPKQFIYLKTLPKNESGKIDKLKLQSLM